MRLKLFSYCLVFSILLCITSKVFAASTPIGYFDRPQDASDCTYSDTPGAEKGIMGWACQTDPKGQQVPVDLYVMDDPNNVTHPWDFSGQVLWYSRVDATLAKADESNIESPQYCNGKPASGGFRFLTAIPDKLKDNKTHYIAAWAIGWNGSLSSDNHTNQNPRIGPVLSFKCLPAPTAIPTSSVTSTPTPTPTPTGVPKPQPAVANVSVQIDSIDANDAANGRTPNHPSRHLTIYLYKDNSYVNDPNGDKAVIKGGSTGNITFTKGTADKQPDSYGTYVNTQFPLGTIFPGQYYVFAKTEGSLREPMSGTPTLVTLDPSASAATNAITFTGDNKLPMGKLITSSGNQINDYDYNAIVSCYGAKVTSSDCTSLSLADDIFPITNPYVDLNDDGTIDGIDYNILIRNYKHSGL